METFLGMVVEQGDKYLKIHLENYVKEVIAKYSGYIKKPLLPKKVRISPGVAFKAEDVPKLPDPTKTEALPFVCGNASVRDYMDLL